MKQGGHTLDSAAQGGFRDAVRVSYQDEDDGKYVLRIEELSSCQ
jgi:hypothetical protein